MNIVVSISSARDLKNVNWRHGSLRVTYIDSGPKRSTENNASNGVNPVWDEKFAIALPSTSDPETAVLYIDILQPNTAGTKPLATVCRSSITILTCCIENRADASVQRKSSVCPW